MDTIILYMLTNKVFFRLMKINTFIEILRDNFEDSDDEEKLTPSGHHTERSTTRKRSY